MKKKLSNFALFMSSQHFKQLTVYIFIAFIVIISLLSFLNSVNKPFTLDEVEEARMAEKINTMGPKTYLPGPNGGGEDLSHPLLYSYTNAIFYRLFGSSEPALRGYGMFFYILSLLILFILMKETWPNSPKVIQTAVVIGGSLYLINPLLIQHSMLLNADNNISAFAIMLYLFLFFRYEKLEGADFIRSRMILGFVVAFNFMCKEITPCFMLAGVMLYRVVNRQFRKAVIDLLLNILLGLILFWAVWYIYCKLTGTDILAFIKFTFMRKSKRAVDLGFLMNQLRLFFVIWKWPWYWASAPFFILVFISAGDRIKTFIRQRHLDRIDFLWISAIAMFTPFIFIKPSIDMMKYQYPTYPAFIFLITWFLVEKVLFPKSKSMLSGKKGNILIPVAALFIFVCSIWYYLLGDYILLIWSAIERSLIVNYYGPILITVIAFIVIFRRSQLLKVISIALLVLVFPINAGLNLNQMKDYTTAECWLNYGESGLIETAKHIRDNLIPKYHVYARKDIQYYLNYRYDMNAITSHPIYIFRKRTEVADRIFRDNPIQYFVFDRVTFSYAPNKEITRLLNKYFFVEKKIGSFVIMRHKASVGR